MANIIKTIKTTYDDLKLKYLTFAKAPELPEDFKPETKEDINKVKVNNLVLLLNKKQDLIQELTEAVENETRLTLEYDHKFNDALLHTDFPEVLGKSRPTNGEKESYIIETNKELYDAKTIAVEETKAIRKHLELIDNRISLEKTILRLNDSI